MGRARAICSRARISRGSRLTRKPCGKRSILRCSRRQNEDGKRVAGLAKYVSSALRMAVLQEAVTSPVRLGGSEPGGWRRIGRGVLLPLGFAALATVGWEILCRMTRISPLLVPAPSPVWAGPSGDYEVLFQQAPPTANETLVSFRLRTVVGVVL